MVWMSTAAKSVVEVESIASSRIASGGRARSKLIVTLGQVDQVQHPSLINWERWSGSKNKPGRLGKCSWQEIESMSQENVWEIETELTSAMTMRRGKNNEEVIVHQKRPRICWELWPQCCGPVVYIQYHCQLRSDCQSNQFARRRTSTLNDCAGWNANTPLRWSMVLGNVSLLESPFKSTMICRLWDQRARWRRKWPAHKGVQKSCPWYKALLMFLRLRVVLRGGQQPCWREMPLGSSSSLAVMVSFLPPRRTQLVCCSCGWRTSPWQ